ncbi:hypothetical protein [Paracoccus ravus]|uniref:hypothetical protein n=1 Tax=Paracoccus ravus TaxID=2447760 RepID=UPI00106DF07F|nr:hypothetical protein [Paracoccus ravus]
MTHDELIAALAPSRLPGGVTDPGWREFLGLFGLGLLLGLGIALLLAPLMRRRLSRRARIRATRGMPPQERLLAVARILGGLPEALRPSAYGAAPPPAMATLERIANRHRRAR